MSYDRVEAGTSPAYRKYREGCSQDLHHALTSDMVKAEDVNGELGEFVSGRKPGRESEEEVIVFDSTGMGLQNVPARAIVYEKALREQTGASLHVAN